MPAVSRAQQIVAAIAKHSPEKLYARNREMAKMSDEELDKFASTPRKGLPEHKRRLMSMQRKRGSK